MRFAFGCVSTGWGGAREFLLLYASAPEFADLYIKYGIEPCVFDPWWIENALRHRSKSAKPLNIHLWIDVGTAREGILPSDLPSILPLLDQSGIVVEGVATHFNAVTQDHAAQKSRFDCALQILADRGICPCLVHAIASHNGLGYNDLTGRLSPGKISREALYNMVRPGCALGLGPRWDLDGSQGEVLRIEIPVREARIAHIKDISEGWNLGYWGNKFLSPKRIAVLEGTRLSSLRYESFQGNPTDNSEQLRTVISHGSIASIELPKGEWHVGDVLKCGMTMRRSFFTQRFERQEDGGCMISAHDARSDQTSQLRIVVRKQSNEHLHESIDRSISLALNSQLEFAGRKNRMAGL